MSTKLALSTLPAADRYEDAQHEAARCAARHQRHTRAFDRATAAGDEPEARAVLRVMRCNRRDLTDARRHERAALRDLRAAERQRAQFVAQFCALAFFASVTRAALAAE